MHLTIWQNQNEKNCLEKQSKNLHKQQQKNGISQQMGENGTGIMQKQHSSHCQNTNEYVKFVEWHTKQLEQQKRAFAQKNAKRQHVEEAVLTMLSTSANSAERNSCTQNTSREKLAHENVVGKCIVSVSKLEGKYPVYCPTVEDGHFILDSGLVVSNSDALGYYIYRDHPINDATTFGSAKIIGRY